MAYLAANLMGPNIENLNHQHTVIYISPLIADSWWISSKSILYYTSIHQQIVTTVPKGWACGHSPSMIGTQISGVDYNRMIHTWYGILFFLLGSMNSTRRNHWHLQISPNNNKRRQQKRTKWFLLPHLTT